LVLQVQAGPRVQLVRRERPEGPVWRDQREVREQPARQVLRELLELPALRDHWAALVHRGQPVRLARLVSKVCPEQSVLRVRPVVLDRQVRRVHQVQRV